MHRSTLAVAAACAAAFLVMSAAASGCRHTPPAAAPQPVPEAKPTVPPPPPPPPPPPAPSSAAPRALTEDEIFQSKSIEQLNAEAPLADALFDYDKSVLRPDAAEAMSRNARWLLRWPTVKVTIEGHCDERGTAEYNLALGDRRAQAVKTYLVSLGVPGDRLTTVTYGKERPVCREATEDCWQRNRRGHPVITAK